LDESGVNRVKLAAVLAALDNETLDDSGVKSVLEASRADASARLPSVETFVHAVCLGEGGAKWIGHCHAEAVMSVLCSTHGTKPFVSHIFPDAIVVCGRHVTVVPYIGPVSLSRVNSAPPMAYRPSSSSSKTTVRWPSVPPKRSCSTFCSCSISGRAFWPECSPLVVRGC
jgi:hypothetical protein